MMPDVSLLSVYIVEHSGEHTMHDKFNSNTAGLDVCWCVLKDQNDGRMVAEVLDTNKTDLCIVIGQNTCNYNRGKW
jgi:hypothetical protein